ncbi:MAG: tetratricopeptide repeat protein [Bacteroidota bacterium]
MKDARQLTIFVFLFLSFAAFGGKGQLTGIERSVTRHLALSEEWINKDLDSALAHATIAKKHFSELTSVELKANILNNLGDIYKSKGEPATALNYYLRAKSLVDEAITKQPADIPLQLLKSDIRLRIGTLYLQLQNQEKALFYYESALAILEKGASKAPKAELSLRKLKVYNNMAAVFIQQQDYETALIYFRNALELNETVKDQAYESSILNNIGICYMEKNELDLASHYFQKTLKIRKRSGDKQGCAQALNNIAKNEVYKGNFESAGEYFEQALALSREIGSKQSALISLESLSTLNDTMGNYREALRFYRQYKLLNDSIFNTESRTAIASLEEAHKRENEKKKYESDRLKSQFTTLALVSTLGLLLLGALLFIIIMRSRVKNSRLQQEKLTLERENLDLVHKTLQENLEFKERELVANALFLLKNNELIARIKDTLLKAKSSFTRENQQVIQEIISELRLGQHNHGWEEFELHFTKVHSQFYLALQEKFPNLTSNELKLCAFLRLNMSTKDISAITNQSVNSITVARSRLRKKLNIDGEDVHLINFLMSL